MLLGVLSGCSHDLSAPLANDRPQVDLMQGGAKMAASEVGVHRELFYPQNAICTLLVTDLNDTQVKVRGEPQWPGEFLLTSGWEDKTIVPVLSSPAIGSPFAGQWIVEDRHGAADTVPFSVVRRLRDVFDTYPPYPHLWQLYRQQDTSFIRPWTYGMKTSMRFHFPADTTNTFAFAGMRSAYRLQGSFFVSLNYKLQGVITSRFRFEVFVSTRPDTVPFPELNLNEYAGFVIDDEIGVEAGLCWDRMPGTSIDHGERAAASGEFTLERREETIVLSHGFEFAPEHAQVLYSGPFTGEDVYFHVRMQARDRSHDRLCQLLAYRIDHGLVVPER
jgi:hypothetical protein